MNITRVMAFGAISLLGIAAWAQEFPRIELGGDYSYVHFASSTPYSQASSLNGGGGSFTYNFNEYLGIKAEFQGYGSSLIGFKISRSPVMPSGLTGNIHGNLFTYLFGPQIKVRTHKVHPFVHALFGGGHSNEYANAYKTICQPFPVACGGKITPGNDGLAMAIGGGIDIPINRTMSIRPAGVDYLMTRFTNPVTGSNNQNNFRYTAGVVFTFGNTHEFP